MNARMFTPGGLTFSQTDQWPLPPKTGFPTAKRPEPEKLWHFTASTRTRSAARRIATVLVVRGPGEAEPQCRILPSDDGRVEVTARLSWGEATVRIDSSAGDRTSPILEVSCRLSDGAVERLAVR